MLEYNFGQKWEHYQEKIPSGGDRSKYVYKTNSLQSSLGNVTPNPSKNYVTIEINVFENDAV
ncbi:MAG TPA: hypothetical protein VLZ83_16775 [Edaphocola sp.]|nr:hypothetical protein [Edaphocola sp.]